MISADKLKCFLIESLRIDADSANVMEFENAELFGSYRVGSADLNGIFPKS